MIGDGVSLNSVAHPVPHGVERLKVLWLRFVMWVTWPLRRSRVIETVEIELPPTKNDSDAVADYMRFSKENGRSYLTPPPGLDFAIAKLELRPGDILVVKSSLPPRHEGMARLVPLGVRVLCIPPDVELSVLTKAEIDQRAKAKQ